MKKMLFGLGLLAAVVTPFIVSNAIGEAPADAEIPVEGMEVATFAGGCFWCVEAGFDKVPGVVKTVSGYTGGEVENPTYKQVSRGRTGHVEALQVYYDPAPGSVTRRW